MSNCYLQNMEQEVLTATAAPYEPPRFEVISLDCEISSYAPDDGGETPLF